MKKIYKYITIIILSIFMAGCAEDWLEDPKSFTLLLPEQVWNDQKMITSLLANYYNRLPRHYGFGLNEEYFASYDEAMAPGSTEAFDVSVNNITEYNYNRWRLWDYNLIRDINKAIEGLDQYANNLQPALKQQFTAEFRYLRAYVYFEMVKRMGGVPIVTSQLIYDYSGDPSYLAMPRNKEAEVYDFIASELDAVKNIIGNDDSKDRANKYTVLALKSRAMLHAASVAKYNNLMPVPITLPGDIVGIPAERANGYYQAALDAAKEIISDGKYSLYNVNPHLGENFFESSVKKLNNPETITVIDYDVKGGKRHNFAYHMICRTMREDNLSSSAAVPPLNLVEAFEYLDGSEGTLKGVGDGTVSGQANWIFYDELDDIFENKDARLYGTVIYPGTTFKGVDVEIQAGVYEWNPSTNSYDRYESSNFGAVYADGKLLTGNGGPMRTSQEVSCTGFYLRKYVDPVALSSARGIGSDVPWPMFKYNEVLLNAAEAAFELGGTNINDALNYINQIRERAGHGPNSLNGSTLTFEKIVNERRVELCYSDHRVWDLQRWRLAHILWDGQAANTNAVQYALYPYRVIHPGSPNDGKYVFDKFLAPKYIAPRFYRLGNYYSSIEQSVLDNNPLIIKNPFH